jgi:hypothetical protein
MKTIAMTIDETTLNLLDELATSFSRHRSRSASVRISVREFAERKRKNEAHESDILHKHKKLLARQAQALIAEQARS